MDGQWRAVPHCKRSKYSSAMGCQVLAHTHTTNTHHIDCLDFSHVPFIDIYSFDKWIWLYIILWIDKSTFHRISSSLWSCFSFVCQFGSILFVSMCLCVCRSTLFLAFCWMRNMDSKHLWHLFLIHFTFDFWPINKTPTYEQSIDIFAFNRPILSSSLYKRNSLEGYLYVYKFKQYHFMYWRISSLYPSFFIVWYTHTFLHRTDTYFQSDSKFDFHLS